MNLLYRLPSEGTSGAVWRMDHCPVRFRGVIFRNWNRVPVERLASVRETTPEQIRLEAVDRQETSEKYQLKTCRN